MGDKKTAIKLFESKEIRTAWDSEKEEWYFSIQDVVEALTDSAKESLRDNMTNTELVLNMLAEVSTTEISRATNPQGLEPSKKVAQQGGAIAKNARQELEEKTGKSAISKHTAKDIKELDK